MLEKGDVNKTIEEKNNYINIDENLEADEELNLCIKGMIDESLFEIDQEYLENYMEIKEKLIKAGYDFYSQTDTEVACKLIDYYY